jgi:GNAT superfamily N-acetyltransferase
MRCQAMPPPCSLWLRRKIRRRRRRNFQIARVSPSTPANGPSAAGGRSGDATRNSTQTSLATLRISWVVTQSEIARLDGEPAVLTRCQSKENRCGRRHETSYPSSRGSRSRCSGDRGHLCPPTCKTPRSPSRPNHPQPRSCHSGSSRRSKRTPGWWPIVVVRSLAMPMPRNIVNAQLTVGLFETTIYVDRAVHRRGVGRTLYSVLLDTLRCQGFRSAFAEIVLPNPGSVNLHESVGFRGVGIHKDIGFKLGHWHDIGYWRMGLAEPTPSPCEPVPFAAFRTTPAFGVAFCKLAISG